MGRIWIAMALGLCLVVLGCPKPSQNTAGQHNLASWPPGSAEHTSQPESITPPDGESELHTAVGTESPFTTSDEEAPDETELGEKSVATETAEDEGNTNSDKETAPTDEEYEPPVEQEGESSPEQESVGAHPFVGPPAPIASVKETGQDDEKPEKEDEPEESSRDAMDPDAARGSLVNGPPGYDAEKHSNSDGGLTGEWQVIAASTDGELRWYDKGDWAMRLNEDNTAVIARKDGTEKWEQHGDWELDADTLKLSLGPGGKHTYQPIGEDADVKVLVEEEHQTALFIVRLDSAAAPQLFHTYQTDFGALSFTSSGPGKWRGSYGDAGGQLDVHLVGPFCIGKWEQSASSGGLILRLSRAGFTGWWWYEGSLGFDGRWNGNTGSN